jgi:hypothetical protein
MDTAERYYVQLVVFAIASALGATAGVKAFANRPWSRVVLLWLSWASAVFWLSSALSLPASESLFPAFVGVIFLLLAVFLHMVEPRSRRPEQ